MRIQGEAQRCTVGLERLIGEEKKKVNKCNIDNKEPEKMRLHMSMTLPGVSSTRKWSNLSGYISYNQQ